MKLKSVILSVLGRDILKRIVDEVQIPGVDRRSVASMRAALSRSKRVAAGDLLRYMRKDEIKAACELVGVSSSGRRDQLVERLGTGFEGAAEKARTTGLDDGTRVKRLKKGWVVIDRHGFFLADPRDAAWVGRPDDREMPPAVFPTPEAALMAWKHSQNVAEGRRRKQLSEVKSSA